MLSGHIAIPALHVQTSHWLKVDCDTFAINGRRKWLKQEWFKSDADWIASPWGYTKPGDQMTKLDDWGDTVDELKKFPRLDLPEGESRCKHPRIASWVMFGKTSFAKWAFNLYAGDVAPVPSQDGYHFYVTKRAGRPYIRSQMKRKGWRNKSSLQGLQKAIAEIVT